jgi:hypothetical protein
MAISRKLAAAGLFWAALARADGAFPDSQALFLPGDQPNRFLLSTNFGIVESVNGAQTWDIMCEYAMLSPNAYLYQMGPGPDHRLLALTTAGPFSMRRRSTPPLPPRF